MAYASGDLNGSGPFYVYVNVWVTSQSQGGNYSTFYWEVGAGYSSGSWPTWSGGTQYWSFQRVMDGWWPSGTWIADFRSRTAYVVGNGYMDVGHDGEGYRGGFENRGHIDTNHSSIGDGSTGGCWVDAPRIPKPASAPTPIGLNQITNESMRYQFSGNDLRGGALVQWEFEYGKNSSFAPGTFISVASSGTTTVYNLDPGTMYYFRSRAVTRGIDGSLLYGSWSATISAETLAGVYVSDGTNWVASGLKVSDGSSWVSLTPKISDGDSWEDPLDV